MEATLRPRDQRGRHGPQISISDDTHHVTDAISSLYDYHDQPTSPQTLSPGHDRVPSNRPFSYLPSARDEISHTRQRPKVGSPLQEESPAPDTLQPSAAQQQQQRQMHSATRAPPRRSKTFDRPAQHHHRDDTVGRSHSAREPGQNLPAHLRSPAETATASFPLNDIDYESSPAAVAQELSNLQAIRRMSMNVDAAGDPDLPGLGMPTVAPSGSADEDDASRLFWVPASLHPELAPTEFKTFIDNRMQAMKRRSGDYSSLSTDGVSRSTSGGGLQRKKSMLSRQIDNTGGRGAEGYQDGAERLERKRSSATEDFDKRRMSSLQDLETLMNDPAKAMRRLSIEASGQSGDMAENDDLILPAVPGGNSLKRSTRTTYRKGSLRKGERVPGSRRAAKVQEPDSEDATSPPPGPEPPIRGLGRVQTEPISSMDAAADRAENFSRPGRMNRRVVSPPPQQQQHPAQSHSPPGSSAVPNVSFDSILGGQQQQPTGPDYSERKSPPPSAHGSSLPPSTSREPTPFVSSFATNGRSTARVPAPIAESQNQQDQRPNSLPAQQSSQQPNVRLDRTSSLEAGGYQYQQQAAPGRTSRRLPLDRMNSQNEPPPDRSLQSMASNPAPLPGNSTRTDNLSFIPTYSDDKKSDKKEKKEKSGWSWGSLLGNEEKDRDKKRDEDSKDGKRSKKAGKTSDSARLDTLQQTVDSGRGRESLVMDRSEVKLEEERKKDSTRRSTEKEKKEKDGIFSSIFGGKKKADRDNAGSGPHTGPFGRRTGASNRTASPNVAQAQLRPDVDYNWTRFSILEERAIYRMAHIKLANPRRALYSQVLLSNFMYSYLAKVQQMHPQIQIPTSAAAKAAQQRQMQQQQKQKDQPEEYSQYQRYQQQQQQLEEEQAAQQVQQQTNQYQQNDYSQQRNGGNYADHQQHGYDYGNGEEHHDHSQLHNGQHGMENGDQHYGNNAYGQYGGNGGGGGYGYQNQQQHYQQQMHSGYQYQQSQFDEPEREAGDEMW